MKCKFSRVSSTAIQTNKSIMALSMAHNHLGREREAREREREGGEKERWWVLRASAPRPAEAPRPWEAGRPACTPAPPPYRPLRPRRSTSRPSERRDFSTGLSARTRTMTPGWRVGPHAAPGCRIGGCAAPLHEARSRRGRECGPDGPGRPVNPGLD